MSINYNFVAVPQDMLSLLYRKHLTGNQLLVLLAISEEVLKFPEGRSSLTRELACRYIANKINISFQAVSRAIKKLVELGLISILEVGKKYVGSIIKLNIPAASETHIVIPGETHNEKCVASGRTNKRTLIKNIKKNNNQSDVDVSLNLISNSGSSSEKTLINSDSDFAEKNYNGKSSSIAPSLMGEKEQVYICPEKITIFGREVNNTVGISDGIKDSQYVSHPLPHQEFKELSFVASGIGIKPSLLSTGIKELASRNCHNLRSTLEDIFTQIKGRVSTIKNKAAYFVSLCQNVELEDLTVPETTVKENSDDNNGFRRPPAWMTGEDEPHPGELHQVEAPPVDLLQEKRKAFAEKISNYFTIGRVKYVLSPAGLPQKIIACNPDSFSYVKDGHMKHVSWGSLPEKLLNDIFFM